MNSKVKSTHPQPGGLLELDEQADDGVVNDSLGTVNIADSNGIDDEKETGEAKIGNANTRED